MIVIGFGGGLGNQMFQYAFYLSMVKRYPQTKFKADIQYAFIEEHNGIEIDKVFGINLNRCSLDERIRLSEIPLKKTFVTRIVKKVKSIVGFHKKSFYKQQDYTEYYPEVYNFCENDDLYFLGVWANEEYFKSLKDELQTDIFTFKLSLNEKSKVYEQHILSQDSVSIHVRKGDFIKYNNHVMDKSYYMNAMDYLEERIGYKPKYFIFSDDIEYAKSLFEHMSNIEYVTGNVKNESWMDMYLMSVCKHNIIANSSFSFWGAYLNRNPDKIVIAPNMPFIGCKNPFTCEEWSTLNETYR